MEFKDNIKLVDNLKETEFLPLDIPKITPTPIDKSFLSMMKLLS